MLLRDAVGGYPDGPGSEEARRRAATLAAAAAPAISLPSVAAGRRLGTRRFRLQLAGIVALGIVVLLAVLLPSRTVRVAVDGEMLTVDSRTSRDTGVVEQAGVDLGPADEVRDAAGGGLVVDRAIEANLEVDGRTLLLPSQAESISELLAEADVPLGAGDSVLRNGVFVSADSTVAQEPALTSLLRGEGPAAQPATSTESVRLEIRRAVPFTIVENGQQLQYHSSRETIATALRDIGVVLGPGDEVQPPLDTELTSGLEVHVDHATQLILTLPAGKAILYSQAETVGAAVAESGVSLPEDYRLEPAGETPVESSMAVHVVGISQEQVLETERIESRTVYEADPGLAWGQRRVVRGQDGVLYRQYTLVYEDGEIVSRELAAEWYDPEPANTVIYYSTAEPAPAPAPLGIPDGLNVVGSLNVYATWYNAASAGRPPSDPSYGLTATGIPVDRGVIAVDPSVIPLGTRLYVPGYGYGVAADTGGGIRGNMIDLGYPDGVAVDWVSRWVDIYILGP